MRNILAQSIVIILLLSSCVPKTLIKAYKQTETGSNIQMSGIDEKSKIQWRIANDTKRLFFTFETSDELVQRIIMRSGFSIYIDTTGRQNEHLTLRVSNQSANELEYTNGQKPENKQMKFNRSGSFKEAYWKVENDEMLIDLLFEKTTFAATYKTDSFGVTNCQVIIPLSDINQKGINGIHYLGIGLNIEPGKKLQHKPSSSGSNDSGEMGRGGNREGGDGMDANFRQGRGMGSGGHRGAGRIKRDNQHNNASQVNFWFVAELAK